MASLSLSDKRSKKDRLLTMAFGGEVDKLKKLAKELDHKGEGIAKVLQETWDSEGKGVLYYAACGTFAGKMNMCKYLVEEIKLDVNDQDENGVTPLHATALDGDFVTAKYLLEHGALPTIAMDKGFTPLHLAANKGHKELTQLLISKGAQVDGVGLAGTPLHCAAALGVAASVEIFLENHVDPNLLSDHDPFPPLITAIHADSIDCVRLLLKGGADPNLNICGMNPLVVAVSDGHNDILTCLLDAGADPNTPSFYDLAPIEIAAVLGNEKGVLVLLAAAATPIHGIPDWSRNGILAYVHSDDFKNKCKNKMEEKVVDAKAKGTEAVRKKQYMLAIHWYTQAMAAKPDDPALYSNRSLCWARLKEGKRALDDAVQCIALRGNEPKAHYRAGVAWQLLRDYKKAAEEFKKALDLDPGSKEVQSAYTEAVLDVQARQAVRHDELKNLVREMTTSSFH